MKDVGTDRPRDWMARVVGSAIQVESGWLMIWISLGGKGGEIGWPERGLRCTRRREIDIRRIERGFCEGRSGPPVRQAGRIYLDADNC